MITAAVTAVLVHLLLGVELLTTALVGAAVASTDAAAVFDLLRKAPLPQRLSAILHVESPFGSAALPSTLPTDNASKAA